MNNNSLLKELLIYDGSKKRGWIHSEKEFNSLESYGKYLKQEYKLKGRDYYFDDIRLTADLLTNQKPILKRAEELMLSDHPYVCAFRRVVYTIGNCCPTWINPATGRGFNNDTIWYKVKRDIMDIEKINTIYEQKAGRELSFVNNLNNRKMDKQMFSIFSDSPSKQELIERLLLEDFFEQQNPIFESSIPLKEKDFINYTMENTRMILKRGVRINNSGKLDEKKLEMMYKEVGLE